MIPATIGELHDAMCTDAMCTALCVCVCVSIEDAKQKKEHDRRVKQAEMKKQSVRKEIGRLRRTFLQLVQRNSQLPLPLQLAANEFTMDPSLEENMKTRAQQQVQCGCVCGVGVCMLCGCVCVCGWVLRINVPRVCVWVCISGGAGEEGDGMGG